MNFFSYVCTWCFLSIALLLSSSSFFCFGVVDQRLNVEIVLATSCKIHDQVIEKTFSTSILLERLTFGSDVYIQKEEFLYLVGLHEGEKISAADIKTAVLYLVKKNKFAEIRLQISDGVEGKWLHMNLIGFWSFQKLKVHGILRGKDIYRQYYIMESGDPFDVVKHEHSIDKIKEALRKEGYFNYKVDSSFSYDYDTKSITVDLFLDKGGRFRVGQITLEISADDNVCQEVSVLKKYIYKKLRRLSGSFYHKDIINDQARIIKRYLAQRGFLQVGVELEERIDAVQKRIHVHWKMDLYQKRLFVFLGNNFFSQQELLDNILQFGRSAWLLPASILSEEIEHAYHDKGFWDVAVTSQEEKERSFLLIKEGARAIISQVEIQNVKHLNSTHLIKKFFCTIVKRKYFDVHILESSLNRLSSYYLEHGFLSMNVVDHAFVPLREKNAYKLVVTVDEGERSYLSLITIEDNPTLSNLGPFRSFAKKKVLTPFNMSIVSQQKKWLLNHFKKQGYMHVTVSPEIKMDENNDVLLTWHINPGQKVRFGKTVILGSNTFPFEYIIRSLQYQPGQVWDQEKVRRSFLRLKELEVYEMMHLYPDQTVQMGPKPMILKVQKDDPFEIRARAGLELQHIRKYQTFGGLTYKIGGTAIIKNPFNVGDQVRMDIDFTRVHREVVAKYRRPWFFSKPIRTIFQAYSIKFNHPGFIGSSKDMYTVTRQGFLLGMHKKTHRVDGGLNFGIEWMETTIRDTVLADCLARAINFEPQLLDKTIPFFFIEPTLFIDHLDHKLNPTTGTFTIISLKGMFPLKGEHIDSYFVKLLVEQSLFIPLRSLVFALRFRFGHIFHKKLCSIMPTERFYLGGSHSLRGYETDFAPPLGVFVDEDGSERVVPRGGKSMLNINVELRFPLFRKKVGGVIFQDMGLLSSDNFADFNVDSVLAATGFGIRFYTPLGPLRFDIGWKWHRRKSIERSFAWFLSFGHAF